MWRMYTIYILVVRFRKTTNQMNILKQRFDPNKKFYSNFIFGKLKFLTINSSILILLNFDDCAISLYN